MYKVYGTVSSRARTLKGINKAIEKSLGLENGYQWFETPKDLLDAKRQGFIEFKATKIILYVDGEG